MPSTVASASVLGKALVLHRFLSEGRWHRNIRRHKSVKGARSTRIVARHVDARVLHNCLVERKRGRGWTWIVDCTKTVLKRSTFAAVVVVGSKRGSLLLCQVGVQCRRTAARSQGAPTKQLPIDPASQAARLISMPVERLKWAPTSCDARRHSE